MKYRDLSPLEKWRFPSTRRAWKQFCRVHSRPTVEPWLRHCQAKQADPVIGITTAPCPPFDLLFSGWARLSVDGSFCHILLQW